MRLHKDGKPIKNLGDWEKLAPPKEYPKQWVDGRSAKELARSCFDDAGSAALPPEIRAVLGGAPDFRDALFLDAVPEHRIPFDGFRGEPRNADLAVVGTVGDRRFALTVEAKADEPFGDTVAGTIQKAKSREGGERSNVPRRVEILKAALFGGGAVDLERLRYQLLTATAGTLAYAKAEKAALAAFVVFECGSKVDAVKMAQNQADLDYFIERLSGDRWSHLPSGTIVGPFSLQGNEWLAVDVPLFIGKAVRKGRS